jgi:hypothetical protein
MHATPRERSQARQRWTSSLPHGSKERSRKSTEARGFHSTAATVSDRATLTMNKPRLRTLKPRIRTLDPRLVKPRPIERIRGRELQEIRYQHFRLYPLCVRCEAAGRTRLATELDHIVALMNGGEDVPSNRQGLCRDCHAIKTAEDLRASSAIT